jgi:6-phosphofructokinase 1
MKKIAVFTSGGDSPGMNACIRAVVRMGIKKDLQVIGIKEGYEGMIDGNFVNMDRRSVSGILSRGGTILNSARSPRFRTKEGRQMAFEQIKKAGIEGIVAIGGDGTFTGADIFTKEFDIPIVGTPGTIDNDLYGTDFTIGYDTAINTAMEAIDKIKDTANAHNRLFFVEVMGRDAGFIALRAGIATGAEAVLIPESKDDTEAMIRVLDANKQIKKRANIIVVAEGDEEGGAFKIAQEVKKRYPEFETKVTVLGHVQRGGSPTCMERVMASRLGMEAVKALLDGKRSVMLGQVHKDVVFTPFEEAIKHHQKVNPVLLDMVEMLA